MPLRSIVFEIRLGKSAKGRFLFFWANSGCRNFCVFIVFWRAFSLQVALKFFLCVISWHSRYLKDCPRSRLFSAHRIMTVQLTIHHLLTKCLTLSVTDGGFGPRVLTYHVEDLSTSAFQRCKSIRLMILNDATENFFGQYASPKVYAKKILASLDSIWLQNNVANNGR